MTIILNILCTERTNLKSMKAIYENLAINVILNGEKLKSFPLRSGIWQILEKEMATHSSILVWKIYTGRGAWQATVPGVAKGQP